MPVETHHPLRVRTIGTRGLKAENNGTRTMESVACIIPLIEQISLNNHMYAHQTRGQLQVDVCIYEALARRQVVRIQTRSKVIRFALAAHSRVFRFDRAHLATQVLAVSLVLLMLLSNRSF